MKLRTVFSLSAMLVTLAAAPAVHAETMLSGHAGWAFSGDLPDSRTTYGGALTFMGGGAFGFEIEGAYTPDFFGDSDDFLGSNNVEHAHGQLPARQPRWGRTGASTPAWAAAC